MALLGFDALSESPISALPESASIADDPTPFDALLATRNGRHPVVQVYVEGLPDVLCTEVPAGGDSKATGYCLDLDGTNDYLATGNITDLAPDGDISIVLWFRPDAISSSGAGVHFLWSWTDSPATKGWELWIDGTSGEIVFRARAGITQLDSSVVVTVGYWHALVVSQGGTNGVETRFLLVRFASDGSPAATMRAFLSGSAGSTGATRAQRNTDSAALTAAMEWGRMRDGTRFFDGLIGYTAIYDRAFTASEMERLLYRILDAKWGDFWDDLRVQIVFDEGSGTKARNSASTGPTYNVTTISGASWSATQPWTITYRPCMTALSSLGQDLEARATRTTIGGLAFTAGDTDGGWLTAWMKRAGLAARRKSAYVFLGFDEILEEDYELVLQGAVESISPLRTRGYEVRIGDAIRIPKASIALGSTVLSTTINSVATTIEIGSLFGFKGRTEVERVAGIPIAGYVRIDDEIIYYESVQGSAPISLLLCVRGRFGTTAAAHTAGAAVKEVWAELAIHPLDMLLSMLLSSTGGLMTHATYDVFTRYTADNATTYDGRGGAMALADIDVTGILAVAAAHYASYAGDFVITDAIDDLKEWLEEKILRPLGAFFYTTAAGKLSVDTWHAPSVVDAIEIEHGDQAAPEPGLDHSKIVNSIVVRYDLNPLTGEYSGILVFEDVDSGRDHGATSAIRIDSPWIRTTGIQSGSTFTPTPTTIVTDLKTVLFGAFSDPQALVSTVVSLRRWALQVAEGILLEHEEIPDFTQGFRGVQGERYQVVGKTLDARRARVALRLLRRPS